MQTLQKQTDRHHRPGTVTVMIVVVILIISGMIAQYARRVIVERRQVVQELQERQTWELAEAGVRRARHLRAGNPAWAGETWTPQVGEGSQAKPSEVVISIQDTTVTVVARYPTNQPRPAQLTQKAELETE